MACLHGKVFSLGHLKSSAFSTDLSATRSCERPFRNALLEVASDVPGPPAQAFVGICAPGFKDYPQWPMYVFGRFSRTQGLVQLHFRGLCKRLGIGLAEVCASGPVGRLSSTSVLS